MDMKDIHIHMWMSWECGNQSVQCRTLFGVDHTFPIGLIHNGLKNSGDRKT